MKGFIKLGLVFALCAGVLGADEFGEARKRYVTKYPSAKSAMEGSGVFVGIELGLAQHTFQIDLSKYGTDKYDMKQAALAVGAKLGYKHFFIKWVGLRGYVDVNYVESRYTMPATAISKQSKGNINGFTNDISYGVNADILLNFYNGETTFFGAFVGVGVGYQNAADNLWGNMLVGGLSGDAVSVQKLNTTRKMSGLYADAKVGLRVNVAKHHEMEFIATIPFTTISKEFSDDGGTTTVPANYRQNYKFMLGYNFVF